MAKYKSGMNSAQLNRDNSDVEGDGDAWCSNDISAAKQHDGTDVLDSDVYDVFPPSAGTVPTPNSPQAM